MISLPCRITWYNDFSYTKGYNRIEKIIPDNLIYFNQLQLNTHNVIKLGNLFTVNFKLRLKVTRAIFG